MYDLVFVGAGLHALTVLCALLEDEPMDEKLVDASTGIVRSKRSERQMRQKLQERLRTPQQQIWKGKKILVIDKHGQWLQNWKKQFEVLQIDFLRSNAGLHPDPFDPEMLFEFARWKGYPFENSFQEITDLKRDQDFVGPFQVPSSHLFNAFCEFLIDNFKLREAVMAGTVQSIEPIDRHFHLHLTSGEVLESRSVVVSIGHTNLPKEPDWIDRSLSPPSFVMHAWNLVHQDLNQLTHGVQSVAIVGGGLTAVQLTQLAVSFGVPGVNLITRRPLSVRQFDSDLTWSGRLRHQQLTAFWKEPRMENRISMIQAARQGGTVTATAKADLTNLIDQKQCRFLEGVEIWDAEWNGDSFTMELSNEESVKVDRIWLATGSHVDVQQEPLFQKILQNFSVSSCGGYPVLDADLKWHPELELYIVGGYGSLALGPDGVNLAGARRAAFRIRNRLRHLFHIS